MSLGLPPRSPSLHWLRWLAHSVLSGLGLFSAACDSFLVSVCQFEDRPGCHTTDLANPDAGQPPREPGSPAPLGPLRRFELRASVPLGSKLRFVGLQGSPRQAVFLAIDGSMNKRWDVASLDLNNSEPTARVRVGGACSTPTCPMIPATMDFALDRIYRNGIGFYYFDYKSQRKVRSLTATIPLDDIILANYRLRPFMSSQGGSMMIIGNEPDAAYALFYENIIGKVGAYGHNVVSVVIGDLDKFDSQNTDLEAMVFDESEAFGIARSSGGGDYSLKIALNIAVQKHSGVGTGPVQAAYIHDINGDSLSDFLFVRGGRFRVVSYRGKDKQGFPHEFGGWADDVAPAITGETVQYVAIDELTQDSYQDLIVETDKNVHFYRNVAM